MSLTDTIQTSILPDGPKVARYLSFQLEAEATREQVTHRLQNLTVNNEITIGFGEPLVSFIGGSVAGLRTFPALSGPGVQVPSTQQALWLWLRDNDIGNLVKRTHDLVKALRGQFRLVDSVDGFKHGDEDLGRDLTGYEDGTENPTGEKAVGVAFVDDEKSSLHGSSFVAVQHWIHDLEAFFDLSQNDQDRIIGRQISDNAEMDDAPPSAHVKRTEQESFEPEAFILRRSMPHAGGGREGLHFVAFGKSLDAFEAQLRRMVGLEDGITDGLFRFSTAVSGAYYWCPPVRSEQLDLAALTGESIV